jgi:hypothetical protein
MDVVAPGRKSNGSFVEEEEKGGRTISKCYLQLDRQAASLQTCQSIYIAKEIYGV